MLPGSLFSTYKQYKEDTRKIVEWLATNARRCGYDPAATQPETAPAAAKKPKLKGRARKIARDAAAVEVKAQQNGPSSSGKQTVVQVREYEPMARCIAESKDTKVIIPVGILKTFKNCIAARTNTAKWYELDPAAKEDPADSNASHGHFIEVLKRSLQILVPIAKLQDLEKRSFDVKAPEVTKDDLEEAVNRFARLEIHDLNEEAYEALADAQVKSTSKSSSNSTKTKYVPEELEIFSEWLFALGCFWEDMEALQDQLTATWEDYASGELDLCTAAVTTNTAIEMVKRAEEEFNKVKRPELNSIYGDDYLPFI